MASKENAQQQQLFAGTQNQYGWKSIKELNRGEIIVITDQEVKVQNIKTDEDFWSVIYTDPSSGKKVEQLYNATDSVYAKNI
jgi:hypothetical protein